MTLSVRALLLLLLAILLAAPPFVAAATYKDQQGRLEWHRPHIGVPAHTAVVRVHAGSRLMFASPDANTVAIVHPKNGSIVWRHLLADNDVLIHSKPLDSEVVASVSFHIPTNSYRIRTWSIASGFIIDDVSVRSDSSSSPCTDDSCTNRIELSTVEISESSPRGGSSPTSLVDLVALLPEGVFVRISRGSVMWKAVLKSSRSTVHISMAVSKSKKTAAVVGHDESGSVVVNLVNLKDGSIDQRILAPAVIVDEKDENACFFQEANKLLIVCNSVSPRNGAVAFEVGSQKLTWIGSSDDDGGYATKVSPKAFVLTTKAKSELVSLSSSEVGDSISSKAIKFSANLPAATRSFAASSDSAENSFALKLDCPERDNTRSGVAEFVDIAAGKSVANWKVDCLTHDRGNILTALLEAGIKDSRPVFRVFLVYQDGTVSLMRQSKAGIVEQWVRDESLAHVVDSAFVDLPDASFHSLENDEMRKIHAIDTENGQTVWTRFLGVDPELKNINVLRTGDVKYPPIVGIFYGKVKVQFETSFDKSKMLNAITGEDFGTDTVPSLADLGNAVGRIIPTSAREDVDNTFVYALVGEDQTIHVYPDSNASHSAFQSVIPSFYYYQASVGESSITGYSVMSDSVKGYIGKEMWSIDLPEGEVIAAFAQKDRSEPVSSIGRVLGSRSVLYKYLNPNLLALVTIRAKLATSNLYLLLIDTVTGTIFHRSAYLGAGHAADGLESVFVTVVDNSIVLAYYNHGPDAAELLFEPQIDDGDTIVEKKRDGRPRRKGGMNSIRNTAPNVKGYEVTVFEMYEMPKPDARIERIYGTPSAEDKEEQLFPYRPALDFNPKDVASHVLEVAGIQKIISTPSSLESTSIVVAYGLDLFVVRRSPSGTFDMLSEDFGYVMLVCTLVFLVVGIQVAKFYAERKRVADQWK
ncbi:hypothetical protein HDU84_006986 [Entophlyctis sp. JEL0112]|nr:hypothetical protein HDU84_006986 [Entophlyctis sp. JEL0112]